MADEPFRPRRGGPESDLIDRAIVGLGVAADLVGADGRSVEVRSFHVADALVAPERLDEPEAPFLASPVTAARSAAYAVLRVVQADPQVDPVEAYRRCHRAGEGFPWDWLRDRGPEGATGEDRTTTALRAVRVAAELARCTPIADAAVIGAASRWAVPAGAVVLRGRIDTIVGNANRAGDAAVHVLTSIEPHPDRWRRVAAYEALVVTLQRRRRPASATVVHPACGTRETFVVDDELLGAGIAIAAFTAEALARARD